MPVTPRLRMMSAALCMVASVAHAARQDPDPAETYNFLAMADWGDDSPGQYATAAGMGVIAEQIGATQVFVLGDNFYHSGLHPNSTDPKSEARIKQTFENVYTAPSLKKIPFWICSGNHDHLGNVTNQIEYSNSSQNLDIPEVTTKGATIAAGKRWRYPNYWHNITHHFEVGGQQIEFEVLLFDSVIMTGNTDVLNEDGTITEIPLHKLTAKTDPLAAEQLAWLTSRMASSTADYLFVGGHYPVWAIGQDPPTGVRQILRDLLNTHEAQYFNGHEHDFEHIIEDGTKVNYISTGAGMYCCYEDKNLDTVPQNSIKFATSGVGGNEWWGNVTIPDFQILSGFTSYRVGPDSMVVHYHAHNGTVLYTTEPILPRTKKPQPPPPPIKPFCNDASCPHRTRPSSPTQPPPPPVPPPPGMEWECRTGYDANGKGVSSLKDEDLTNPPFGLPSSTLQMCQEACTAHKDCLVINWHTQDNHCHVLTGSITYNAWESSLEAKDEETACMLKYTSEIKTA